GREGVRFRAGTHPRARRRPAGDHRRGHRDRRAGAAGGELGRVLIKSRLLTARSGRFEPMALRRVVPILVVAILASGAAANEVDPIIEQYRAEDIDSLLKPALQKAEALALEGRVSESNQALLDAVPEAKRQPVHDLALGNVLYRTRPDISRALHRKA